MHFLIFSITYFTPVLWPEFSLWQLLSGIFFFQRQHQKLENLAAHAHIGDQEDEKWEVLEQRRQVILASQGVLWQTCDWSVITNLILICR